MAPCGEPPLIGENPLAIVRRYEAAKRKQMRQAIVRPGAFYAGRGKPASRKKMPRANLSSRKAATSD